MTDLQHPATATKMGSRRIFAAQFKLQVLDSYRNDSDCKGNQRATARKYGIHRRQIQKWLQCESNLRSSVVLNGGKTNQTNGNHTTMTATKTMSGSTKSLNGSATGHVQNNHNLANGAVTIKMSYAPTTTKTTGTLLRSFSASAVDANALALDKTRHSVALNNIQNHSNNNNGIGGGSGFGLNMDGSNNSKYNNATASRPSASPLDATRRPATFAVSSSSIRSHAYDVAPAYASQHYPQLSSTTNCLPSSPVFSMPIAMVSGHPMRQQSHINRLDFGAGGMYDLGYDALAGPALTGYKYAAAAPYTGSGYSQQHVYNPEMQEPIRPSPVYSVRLRDDLAASHMHNELTATAHVASPMDLSTSLRTVRDASPQPAQPCGPYFWEAKQEPETKREPTTSPHALLPDDETMRPIDLSGGGNRKRRCIDNDDEGISLSHAANKTTSLMATKMPKLFRPYELSSDDDDIDIVDDTDDTKKSFQSDNQRDPIIWSNHPSYGGGACEHAAVQSTSPLTGNGQTFPASYWLNHGSPVSGYDSGSSTFSTYSDCNCIDPMCGRLCTAAVSPASVKADSMRSIKSPRSPFSDSDEGIVRNSSVQPTNYRRQILQRWSHEEDELNASTEQRLLIVA